jgi:hypothetical protein
MEQRISNCIKFCHNKAVKCYWEPNCIEFLCRGISWKFVTSANSTFSTGSCLLMSRNQVRRFMTGLFIGSNHSHSWTCVVWFSPPCFQVQGFVMNKFESSLDSSVVDCLRWGSYLLDYTIWLDLPSLKGTVQRKLTGVESCMVFLLHWSTGILFLNVKRTGSSNRNKQVSTG